MTTQTLKAYENGKFFMTAKISSGMRGRETPVGRYTISQKKKKHRSTLWPKPSGGARMPYMMRLGSTPIALHLGNLPGYPASHGCVRIEDIAAQKLYKWSSVGTQVDIEGHAIGRNFEVKNIARSTMQSLYPEHKYRKKYTEDIFPDDIPYNKGFGKALMLD